MDHSELGEDLNGFRFKFLEPPEYDEALALIHKYLLPAMTGPFGYDPKYPDDWLELFSRMMRRNTNLSFIAVHIETGEIASLRMIDLVEQGVASDLHMAFPPYFKHKTNIDVFKLCDDICKDIDMFKKFGITKYIDMFGLVTHAKYRQRGLAIEMYRRGLNYLQKRGFEIVKCSFISPYSRKAGQKNGFIEFARRYFHDCKDDEGNILNPNSDPTEYIDFGYFDLRNRQIQ